ncbi:MAG: hypothetical protein M3285_06715 [Actinomycetota bacterium]|nr:hypothetical protein [Actinomycetota bacterium]
MIDNALEALTRAGVDFAFRKGPRNDAELPRGGEVDLEMSASDLRQAEQTLAGVGFFPLRARGHFNHRFFLAFDNGRWIKIDVKTKGKPRGIGSESGPGRVFRGVARRIPLSLQRSGPVIALLGPDGAGKGSVGAALQERVPIATAILYFGSGGPGRTTGPDAADPALPHPAREALWHLLRVLRHWRRLTAAYLKAWRGVIVICDRHPIEVVAIRPPRRLPKLERFLFRKLIPKPDLVIVLDAPGEALFARKREHSADVLERMRDAYRREFGETGVIVSAAGPLDETVAEVSEHVWRQLKRRRGW